MLKIRYLGKHSEICRLISEGKTEEALAQLYGFFRSEENTDSYSVELLTILRELLEDDESESIARLKIRMERSADRVMMNLAQFIHALAAGGLQKQAQILSEKCFGELAMLKRSMERYRDEVGVNASTEMAGQRIREAVRIWRIFVYESGDDDRLNEIDDANLEMVRIFLGQKPNEMSNAMMIAAKCAARRGDTQRQVALCRDIADAYGDVIEKIEHSTEFSRENFETLDGVRYAYEVLDAADGKHSYAGELAAIKHILDNDD